MPDRDKSELREPSAAWEPPDFLDYFGPDPTGGRRSHINLWLALRMIREAVEDCAPPGSVPNDEHLTPEPWFEAEALVRGVYAIAERRRG